MKGKLNLLIDALMFVIGAVVCGLGFLMKYRLIPGQERIVRFGRQVDLSWLGLDRHEWGAVHLILGFIMIGLLVLHIVLHWNLITCLYRKVIRHDTLRKLLAVLFTGICIVLLVFPLIIRIEIREILPGEGHHSTRESHHTSDPYSLNMHVQGSMTLQQVSNEYQIPVQLILNGLDLPDDVSSKEQLGHLRKQYSFRMHDVERIIAEYKAVKKPTNH